MNSRSRKPKFNALTRLFAVTRSLFKRVSKHPVICAVCILAAVITGLGGVAESLLTFEQLTNRVFGRESSNDPPQKETELIPATDELEIAPPTSAAEESRAIGALNRLYNAQLQPGQLRRFEWFDFSNSGNATELIAEVDTDKTDFEYDFVTLTTIGGEPLELLAFDQRSEPRTATESGVLEFDGKNFLIVSHNAGSGSYLYHTIYEWDAVGPPRAVYEDAPGRGKIFIQNKRAYISGDGGKFQIHRRNGAFKRETYSREIRYPELGLEKHILLITENEAGKLKVLFDNIDITDKEEGFEIPVKTNESILIDQRIQSDVGSDSLRIDWHGLDERDFVNGFYWTFRFQYSERVEFEVGYDRWVRMVFVRGQP